MGACIVFWLGLAFPPNKMLLYVSRAGLSICVYIIVTILNPLVAELSPPKFRGLAGSFTEISGALGALIGYLLAFLAPWDEATALCTLTAVVLFVPLLFVTEVSNRVIFSDLVRHTFTTFKTLCLKRYGFVRVFFFFLLRLCRHISTSLTAETLLTTQLITSVYFNNCRSKGAERFVILATLY